MGTYRDITKLLRNCGIIIPVCGDHIPSALSFCCESTSNLPPWISQMKAEALANFAGGAAGREKWWCGYELA